MARHELFDLRAMRFTGFQRDSNNLLNNRTKRYLFQHIFFEFVKLEDKRFTYLNLPFF